jgi:neutral ceramidase
MILNSRGAEPQIIRNPWTIVLAVLTVLVSPWSTSVFANDSTEFRAGFASVDITPTAAVPLWGYGAEHRPDNLSTGTHDPLYAKALVLEAGESRAVLVGLDLGRAPFEPMVRRIEAAVERRANVGHVFLVGSHTHHGPALELVPVKGDEPPGLANAFAYYSELETKLVDVIVAAAEKVEPATWGWASGTTAINRNRHTEDAPIPIDSELFVLRVDGASGEPIALAVNMAAHPTNHPHGNNQFSADFPGVMMNAVEEATGTPCLFLQGAAGDMQCDVDDAQWGKVDQMQEPGAQLAVEVLALNDTLTTAAPSHPDIRGDKMSFSFGMRLNLNDPATSDAMRAGYGESIFSSYSGKYADGTMHPKLTTLLINGELALAGGSGEFFSDLSVQLKAAVEGPKALFLGYCNGHDMYFPTERAINQGGYGADAGSAWVAPGAPEKMIAGAVERFGVQLREFKQANVPAAE